MSTGTIIVVPVNATITTILNSPVSSSQDPIPFTICKNGFYSKLNKNGTLYPSNQTYLGNFNSNYYNFNFFNFK